MDRKLGLAVVLMIAVIVLSNLVFPPGPPRDPGTATDSGAVTAVASPGADSAPPAAIEPTPRPVDERAAEPAEITPAPEAEQPDVEEASGATGDTIFVRSDLWELAFSTRGARMIGAAMETHLSYAPDDEEEARVQLIRTDDALFGFRIAVEEDTVDLRDRIFTTEGGDLDLRGRPHAEERLSFTYAIEETSLVFRVTYTFHADTHVVELAGVFEGIGGRGYTVLSELGRGIRSNEAEPPEDFRQMAYVVQEQDGSIVSHNLSKVAAGDGVAVVGAPFRWVASKSKYFLVAFVTDPPDSGFGGLIVDGNGDENSAHLTTSLPVLAGQEAFGFRAYIGPQDFGRLRAVGYDLHSVNPVGWRWLQWFIRPFASIIMSVLVWLHVTFSMSYGWVLILFGVLTRIVLFPLYQKSMRAQMAQMQVQPQVKEIQEKYKEDPQRLQKEMMAVYKEHGVNPLGGCLPMLIPFPILITLFFVFQNTIEFRGVPFLWLPDLSLADPFYIVPLLMGASMFLLNWIGQRGMPPNPQTKIIGYVFPVVFTFLFARFASGLNLYYASSNIASLPQQMYLSRERRKARSNVPAPATATQKDDGSPTGKAGDGADAEPPAQKKPPGRKPTGKKASRRKGRGR